MLKHAQDLIALARETSSDRRRDLLRAVSDLFIELDEDVSPESRAEFARTVDLLLEQLDVEVRREFAERFAAQPNAPADLMARLAHDVIEVARPVLRESEALPDSELLAVAMVKDQDHLRAITERAQVSEMVSDAIVHRGDDETVVALVENLGARFSRRAFELLADRSETVEALRTPLATRQDTPLDIVHEMLVFVESEVREQIMRRVRGVSAEELEEALRCARERAEMRRRSSTDDAKIRREIREMKSRGRLTKSAVVDFLRGADEPRFIAGLAALMEMDTDTIRKLWRSTSIEPLAIAVRAWGADRAFFVTMAMEREGAGARDAERARTFGDDYEAIPPEAAKRVIRFWRVRRDADAA